MDEDLIVPNHEDYLEDALENRERYNGKLGNTITSISYLIVHHILLLSFFTSCIEAGKY